MSYIFEYFTLSLSLSLFAKCYCWRIKNEKVSSNEDKKMSHNVVFLLFLMLY